MNRMNKLGLVLAGGGGKGAYQIGVWKYLHEIGLDNYVCAVSGTSVGALNAMLFAIGDIENAEHVWRSITPDQILSPRKPTKEEVERWLAKALAVGSVKAAVSNLTALAGFGITQLTTGILSMMGQYAFSRDGMQKIMREEVDLSAISSSPIPCYATCVEIPVFAKCRFDLREYNKEEAETILLASSAIPIVYDIVHFNGKDYYDGGLPIVGDNVPVQPVYDYGANIILAVHLSRDKLIDRSQFPNAKIIEIVPQTDLGNMVNGTLDFSPSGVEWRITQGYEDAKKILEPFVGAMLFERRSENVLQSILDREQKNKQQQSEMEKEREAISEARSNDGVTEIFEHYGRR